MVGRIVQIPHAWEWQRAWGGGVESEGGRRGKEGVVRKKKRGGGVPVAPVLPLSATSKMSTFLERARQGGGTNAWHVPRAA